MAFKLVAPYQPFLDDSGKPRAEGLLTVRVNNSTTKKSIFSDAALSTAQSNPYTLDAFGQVIGDVHFSGLARFEVTNKDGSDQKITDDNSSSADNTLLVADMDTNGFDILFDDEKGIRDASDNEQLIFQKVSTATNFFEITNSATAGTPKFSAAGSDTNVPLEIESKGSGNIVLDPGTTGDVDIEGASILIEDAEGIKDDSGNEQLIFQKTASAITYVEITNATTGNGPIIGSAGESNVNLNITPNGTGDLYVNADTLFIEQDLTHIGDTNNKFVFGTDTQDLQTGGSSRLDISDSGIRLGAANARVTTVLDEDTLSSNSATSLVTQQSVKAYIDTISISVNNFRLSLTSGTSVTASDVTAATSVYMALHDGNRVSVFTGSVWVVLSSAELSVAVPSTTNTPFDIFLDYNSGTLQLVTTNWTNDTTRATALTTQNGRLVQTGNTDFLYLGTARTTGVSGQTEDSLGSRYLWNYYHRRERPMCRIEGTDSWTYTTATIRAANGSTNNRLNFVTGVSEDMVTAILRVAADNTNADVAMIVGLGLDTTSAFTAGGLFGYSPSLVVDVFQPITASWSGYSGIGGHYISWNEYSAATGTTTWAGDGGTPTLIQSGITGFVRA